MRPNAIQDPLVLIPVQHGVGRRDENGILVRHDEDELSTRAESAVGLTPGPPELVSVPASTFQKNSGTGVIDRLGCALFYPALRQNPDPVPDSVPQIKLAEPCHILGRAISSAAALVNAERTGLPFDILHPEGLEQACFEIFVHGGSRDSLEDGTQRMRTRRIVSKDGTRGWLGGV